MPAVQPLPRAAGLVTAVRTLGQGVVARARALATSGPSSQSAPRTAMSAWGPAEEVDEGVERHGADWQGIKEPYQLSRERLGPRHLSKMIPLPLAKTRGRALR